jgi:hypothetical protein
MMLSAFGLLHLHHRLDLRSSLPFVALALVIALLCCQTRLAIAQADPWRLGGSGQQWSLNDTTHIFIDFGTHPRSIQPLYIEPDQNVFALLDNWSPLKWPRDLGFVEGERPRAWKEFRGGEASDLNGTYLVDGDSTTYIPPSTLSTFYSAAGSDWYTFDLAVPVPIDRFGFFTPSQGFRADGRPLREDAVPAYEVSIAPESSPETQNDDYALLQRVIADVDENFQPDVLLRFPLQYVRYVRFRQKPSLLDETIRNNNTARSGGLARDGTIGDFELFGRGIPRQAIYKTKVTDLGPEGIFGRLFWSATPMRRQDGQEIEAPDADVSIQVEVRIGRDNDPDVYHEFTDKGLEVVVSRQRYEFDLKPPPSNGGLIQDVLKRPGVRASIQYDTKNWSFWSPPFTRSGQPLRLRNGSHVQLKITLGSERFDEYLRLDSLWIERAAPLARQVVGEVARLDDPDPSRGRAEVPLGQLTDFSYDIAASFEDGIGTGFDAVRMRTGGPAQFGHLELGDPPVITPAQSVVPEEDGLTVFLPQRITPSQNSPIRIVLGTRVFTLARTFEGEVFDSDAAGLPQPIDAGDVRQDIGTNSLRVLGASDDRAVKPLREVRFSTAVLTPNGDGVNDHLELGYTLFRLPIPVPVRLEVYALNGRRLASLDGGLQSSGQQRLRWDGRGADGRILAPGLYILELSLHGEVETFRHMQSVGIAY